MMEQDHAENIKHDAQSTPPAAGHNASEGAPVVMTPIGIIHSPFADLRGMPIQPPGGSASRGTVEVFEPYQRGLRDLEGFSHIFLLYVFHRSRSFDLEVVPFMDAQPRGLFATRAPNRPNPIGMSVVQLDKIEAGTLHIRNLDILDGTPLLDIKPYVPNFDVQRNVRTGWLEKAKGRVARRVSDDRFQ